MLFGQNGLLEILLLMAWKMNSWYIINIHKLLDSNQILGELAVSPKSGLLHLRLQVDGKHGFSIGSCLQVLFSARVPGTRFFSKAFFWPQKVMIPCRASLRPTGGQQQTPLKMGLLPPKFHLPTIDFRGVDLLLVFRKWCWFFFKHEMLLKQKNMSI